MAAGNERWEGEGGKGGKNQGLMETSVYPPHGPLDQSRRCQRSGRERKRREGGKEVRKNIPDSGLREKKEASRFFTTSPMRQREKKRGAKKGGRKGKGSMVRSSTGHLA